MTKAQIAALALATSLGAAGGAIAVKSDTAAKPEYRVHAMDLRRGQELSDGGFTVSTQVWADKKLPDGGWKDLGRGNPCRLSDAAELAQRNLMKQAEACVEEK